MDLSKIVLTTMVVVWAARLGAYLLYRIHAMGKDNRFDEMRNTLPKIASFWFL